MSSSSLPPSLQVCVVNGSLSSKSSTRAVLQIVCEQLRADGVKVDEIQLPEEPLPLFVPESFQSDATFAKIKPRVEQADVLLLGTPDYHGSMSGALKNFLDHFWREFSGKLFATIVASYEKGLTVTDQLRTVARQCYAWSLPYGVSFAEKADVKEGVIVSDSFRSRLAMFVRDVRVYGGLLAQQRAADLAGTDPGFMALHRK